MSKWAKVGIDNYYFGQENISVKYLTFDSNDADSGQ